MNYAGGNDKVLGNLFFTLYHVHSLFIYTHSDRSYHQIQMLQILLLKKKQNKCDYGLLNINIETLNKIKTETYLLCDNTKLIVLDNNNSYLYNINKHKFDYSLMKLEYFNAFTQTLNFIQFILYSNDNI